METTHEELQAISQLFYETVYHVMRADATPMLALWCERNGVTYCDPYGRFHQGHEALVAYWQLAARINSQSPGSVSVTAKLRIAQRSNERIYTVMVEHIQIREGEQVLRQKGRSAAFARRAV